MTFKNVVKATIFLKSMDDFAVMNDIYASYLDAESFPARETVQVSCLPKKCGYRNFYDCSSGLMNFIRNTIAVIVGLGIAGLIITLGIRVFPQWITFEAFAPFEHWERFLQSMQNDDAFFGFLCLFQDWEQQ